ncbi:hypothetical protein Ocin01_13853 [Orchesella cincta]|uniref:Uncharacterized protein n=1 Tax=Orchesella cincta TaxID=48709 RepID=A0A1D2MIQ4_ORCCI|nr:hypothetical protein Ocin01_13853 [Orchesella cincta]
MVKAQLTLLLVCSSILVAFYFTNCAATADVDCSMFNNRNGPAICTYDNCPAGYSSKFWDTGCSCDGGNCQRCCAPP